MRSEKAIRSGRRWGVRCAAAGLLLACAILFGWSGSRDIVGILRNYPLGVLAGLATLFLSARSLGAHAGSIAARGSCWAVVAGVSLATICVAFPMAVAGAVETVGQASNDYSAWRERFASGEVSVPMRPDFEVHVLRMAKERVLGLAVVTLLFGAIPAVVLGAIFANRVRATLCDEVEHPFEVTARTGGSARERSHDPTGGGSEHAAVRGSARQ
jgi:hypothetical protein